MTDVVLLHDADCPNVEDARRNLLEALERSATPRRWRELLSTDASTPEKWRGYGSPTILVASEDVAGEPPAVGDRSCRMYRKRQAAAVAVGCSKCAARIPTP